MAALAKQSTQATQPSQDTSTQQQGEESFESNQAVLDLLAGTFGADPTAGGGTSLLDLVEKDAPTGMPSEAEVQGELGELPAARVYAGTEGASWALAVLGAEAAVIGDVMLFSSSSPSLEVVLHEARHLQQTGGQPSSGPLTVASSGSAEEQDAQVGMASQTGDPDTVYCWSWRGFAAGALGGAVIGGILGFVLGGPVGAGIGAVGGAALVGGLAGVFAGGGGATPEQQARQALDNTDAAALLQVLAGVDEATFRTILATWTQGETRWLLTNLPGGHDADLVRRIRAERVVQGALSMEDQLYWSGPAGADPHMDPTTTTDRSTDDLTADETNDDQFAQWILGGPEPSGVDGQMNCWEAVMFSAYKGGVVDKAFLVDIYDRCRVQGQANGEGAWYATLEQALGVNAAVAMDATHEPARGDIVFMDGLAHVALSLGSTTGAGEHEVMSLWILPMDGQNLNSTFQRTTLEMINDEWVNKANKTAMAITFAPNPF